MQLRKQKKDFVLCAQVHQLSQMLQRDADTIIRQCVEGILEMVHAPEGGLPAVQVTPLIVEEIGLRRRRAKS